MFRLWEHSGSRPSFWPSPRLSPPASPRGWQRSVHKPALDCQIFILTLHICAFASLSLADLNSTRDEGRHGCSDVPVREDGQRHQGLHQHATGWLNHLWGNMSVTITDNLLLLRSSSTVAAWSRWTSGPFRVSLWGRRTRTKACFICGRRSSSCHGLNGTKWQKISNYLNWCSFWKTCKYVINSLLLSNLRLNLL